MVDNEKIMSVINDMKRDGHVMESGDFVTPDNEIYRYKIQKLRKAWKQ